MKTYEIISQIENNEMAPARIMNTQTMIGGYVKNVEIENGEMTLHVAAQSDEQQTFHNIQIMELIENAGAINEITANINGEQMQIIGTANVMGDFILIAE